MISVNGRYSVCISGAKILKEIGDCGFRAVILTTNFQVRTDLQMYFFAFIFFKFHQQTRQKTKAHACEFKLLNNRRDSLKSVVDKSSIWSKWGLFWALTRDESPREVRTQRIGQGRVCLWWSAQSFNFQACFRCCENNNSDQLRV